VLKFVLMATLALATSAAAQPSLERGDYLVNAVMACDGCHTPRGPTGFVMEKRFSGGSQTWDDPAYTVKGSNVTPVCSENLVRIDLLTESPHVGDDGRADNPVLEPGRVAL
jgi:hypothetical protein